MSDLNAAYAAIHESVADADATRPNPLRAALTDLFVNHPAVRPHDQCRPANAKMIRYKLTNGLSLGHQIETTPQHLWFAVSKADLPASLSGAKIYPATVDGKGRHSNVNQMPDLRDKAVVRLTVSTVEEAETLLNHLVADAPAV
jgi:hypothetical protein